MCQLRRWVLVLSCLVAALAGSYSLRGEEAQSPFIKILMSGRLPDERVPTVIEMVCRKGSAADLAYVYQQALAPDKFSPATRLKALEALAEAASIRKLQPEGDLAGIGTLVAKGETPQLQMAAVRLAALWKVASVTHELRQLAEGAKTPDNLRQAALEGLVTLGSPEARQTLAKLTGTEYALALRLRAAAGLASIDLEEGAQRAAGVLAQLGPKDNPAPVLEAFLTRQGGAAKLASALANAKLKPDVAKVVLRTMYVGGHSEPELADVLSAAAGIAANTPPPTPAEIAQLVNEVNTRGNATRGEAIFRRADVACMKCHSVARAGGIVGPDLSPLGATSPPDYVANSILQPSLAIKEQYLTKIILTGDGQVVTGIVVDRNDQQVRVRDASGKITAIALEDIDDEREGKSLMPEGLTRFLTREELVDLIRFVAELGKPGPWAIRTTPSVQRWRVLREPPSELVTEVPNLELVRIHLLEEHPENWVPAYGRVGGLLPLAELAPEVPAGSVFYLQAEIDVVAGGELAFASQVPPGTQAWVNADPVDAPAKFGKSLDAGRHKLTLRVVTTGAADEGVMVEVSKPGNSSAQFEVVAGP